MSTLAELRAAAPSTRILAEGWDYQIGEAGNDGAIRFMVAGLQIQPFCDALAGLPGTTLTIGGASVTRLIPLRHPRDPGIYAFSSHIYPAPNAVANPGPEGSGFGIDFEWYLADVKFRTPKWSPSGDYPMTTIERDSGLEMRTVPGTAYKFPSDGLVVLHDVGVPNQVTQYAITFEGLPSLDNDLYDSLIGAVNSSTFFGKPAGTMLYLGCSSSGQYRLGGVPAYRARQLFAYSRIPHREIMRPDGAAFEAPVRAGDPSKYLLESLELNALYS